MSNAQLKTNIDKLNPAQREAVLNTVGPELVIAGAGSGKTRVLTTRIALLMEQGILPDRILALTFTKKAAEEMRKRIIEMEGESARRIRMGTFHSVFITFLRPYAQYLGFPQNFTILNEDDALATFKQSIEAIVAAGRPPKEKRTPEEEKRFKTEDNNYKPKSCFSRISFCKNELITVQAYRNSFDINHQDQLARRPLLARIYEDYCNRCFRSGVMDFDDILLYTDILLANNPQICNEIAASFDYILVDEYQDTNKAQYSILKRLTQVNKNICVVGDDSQSIYAFRGARIENIFNFEKEYKGCKIVRLEENYRSTKAIVEGANRLIAQNDKRIPKTCFSNAEQGEPIEMWELENEREEANFIARKIVESIKKYGFTYRDFAVLYRTNSQSRALEDALIRKSIPYVIYSGTNFFERQEIKDQMAFFKLAVNPNDDASFRRVVNIPTRGVGKAALEKLSTYAGVNNMTLWQAINSPEVQNNVLGLTAKPMAGIQQFRTIIESCRELARTKKAYDAANEIMLLVGIHKAYKDEGSEESLDRANNIRELIDSVKAFEEEIEITNKEMDDLPIADTLGEYLQNIMLLSNADTDNGTSNKVSLMTVHCAKGLEYSFVFVAGMESDLFPLNIEGTPKELEEERRLFYVAATRAKKNLILTKAEQRLRYGKRNDTKDSCFIDEILPETEPED